MKDGFLKAAAFSPALRVADCTYNAQQILTQLQTAAQRGVKLAVFPEFCLTGYTCGDLFLQRTLQQGALDALEWLLAQTRTLDTVALVGLPLLVHGKLYNCAAVLCRGQLLGIVPKTYLPNYGEFYEKRQFTPGSTEVELRAVRDSAEHADGRDVYLIFEPMAAALGIGIDVEAPEGNMIVDIGGGSTEIAVISLGGIVSNNSIRVAGDDLTADIQEYMSRQHNVKVSERMAERIKVHVGSALTDLGEDAPEDYVIHGPNRITALPMEVPVCYQEIAHCLDKTVAKIENAVLSALENTPPELYADIVKNGIWLTGGGALLRGLDKRLTDKINIPFHIAEDPLHSVATGAGIALKNVDRFSFLMR